jgi:hypothetical protein
MGSQPHPCENLRERTPRLSICDAYVNQQGSVGGTPRQIARNYGAHAEMGAMFADEPAYFAQ